MDPLETCSSLIAAAVLCAATGPNVRPGATLHAGPLTGRHSHSYAWALDYTEGFGCYLADSIAWLEGHHRDGPTVQLWDRPPLFERRFVVALGVGIYRHIDTYADEQARQRKPAHEKPEYVLRESINDAFQARIAIRLDYLKNQYEISNKKQPKSCIRKS